MTVAPRVSAIVPNYNHGSVLPTAIAALQAQTGPFGEIIIVDDGSTDDSRAIIGELAAGDRRIREIRHPQNRGAIAALNSGIAAASGQYVYLGAADDVVRPDLVTTLLSAAERHPEVGLVCGEIAYVDLRTGVRSVRPATRPAATARGFSPDETAALFAATDNVILTGASLIDRKKLLDCGGLRPELGSFADGFAVRQLALRHGFAFVPAVVAEWRVDDSGLSRRTASDPAEVEALLQKMHTAFASDPAFPLDYPERFERRWRFGVLRLALDRPETARALFEAVGTGAVRSPLIPALAGIPVIGKTLALGFLTLAYRPFSLRALAATALSRSRS